MTTFTFDTASTITPAVLDKAKAEGLRVVMVYLKYLTPSLLQLVWARGLAVGLVFETEAKRALGGSEAGVADGKAVMARLTALPGVALPPPTTALFLTADFDAQVADELVITKYLTGARLVLESHLLTSLYGNGALLAKFKAMGLISYGWLMGGSKTRGTADYTGWDIKQDVGDAQKLGLGISIDSDTVSDPAAPWAWHPPGVIVRPTPKPEPAPEPAGYPVPAAVTLQATLQRLGFYPGELDGDWGDASAAALRAYYRSLKH